MTACPGLSAVKDARKELVLHRGPHDSSALLKNAFGAVSRPEHPADEAPRLQFAATGDLMCCCRHSSRCSVLAEVVRADERRQCRGSAPHRGSAAGALVKLRRWFRAGHVGIAGCVAPGMHRVAAGDFEPDCRSTAR